MREIPNSSKMLAIIKFLVCFWGAIAIIIAKYYPKVSYPKVIFCIFVRSIAKRLYHYDYISFTFSVWNLGNGR